MNLLDPGILKQRPTSAEKTGPRSILLIKDLLLCFNIQWIISSNIMIIRFAQVANINSRDEHEALQYEIHRRGYNKYGVRSDAYIFSVVRLVWSASVV